MCDGLRDHTTRLRSWTDNNRHTFNTSNCKVLHPSHVTDNACNSVNSLLGVYKFEKYLKVMALCNLKSYVNCDSNVFRANLSLITLKRVLGECDSRMVHLILDIFTRAHSEYVNIVFLHALENDKNTQ